MTTLSSQRATHPSSTTTLCRTVLLFNGGFLALTGGVQMVFELLSHFMGKGPYGRLFAHSPYTIGFVEAHGLAFLIGLLLIRVAANPQPHWPLFAIGVHLLLGGANLLFWDSFVQFGLVIPAVIATLLHGVFLTAQVYCFKLSFKQ
jgi:hypothetical protein